MSLIVYTGVLPQPRRGIAGYDGDDALDVTRSASGFGRQFGPSKLLLNEAQSKKRAAGSSEKRLQEVWEWYAPLYIAEMGRSIERDHAPWEALLGMELVTLQCYCRRLGGAHCHRRLLAEILVRLGATYKGERT